MGENPDFGLLDILNLLEARTSETLQIIKNLKLRANNNEINFGDNIVINVGDDHEAFNKHIPNNVQNSSEIYENMSIIREEEEEAEVNFCENNIVEQKNCAPIQSEQSSQISENIPKFVRNSEINGSGYDYSSVSSRDVIVVPDKEDQVCFLSQYLKYPEVELNKPLDVSFTLIYSTRNFFLQLDYSKLVEFQRMFNEIYSGADKQLIHLDPSDVEVGEVYALFYVCDEVFYRVQVLRIIDKENVEVIYIDFGDVQIAPKKDLKIILDRFKNMPVFALNCYIESGWTSNFLQLDTAFLQFIEENQLHFKKLKATFSQPVDYKYPVSLTLIDANQVEKEFTSTIFQVEIHDLFTKARFNLLDYDFKLDNIKMNAAIIQNSYERLDSQFDFKSLIPKKLLGFIAEKTVGDLGNFLVTLFSEESNDLLVNNFVTNSTNYYVKASMKKLSSPAVDSLVMIRNNKHFFRAMVLSRKTYEAEKPCVYEVFAFDIGDILTKETTDIFPMVQTFSLKKFIPFTFMANLFKLVPQVSRYGQDWSPLAKLQFLKSFVNPVQIIVRSYKNGKFGVDVINKGQNVSESIVKSKLARNGGDEDCLMFVD